MTRIGQATMLLHGGDREEARNRLAALWEQIGADGDPLQRCTLAHCLADAQDDPDDELAWDLRALSAAEGETEVVAEAELRGAEGKAEGPGAEEGRSARPAAAALRALYPSLHLNLAADYLKLHRPDAARAHLDRARAASESLDPGCHRAQPDQGQHPAAAAHPAAAGEGGQHRLARR
ncbi:hypothetical protein, partial [Streptomyces sp. NPDC006307]|uniref:hypothetical protein n=1 Tax=Streptomyces sp. NPDC006307 TaxID=3156748 RepID=UPI0033A76433